MDARPEQPPEGRLIAAALDRSGLSIREAAKRAGISYGRWRQIVNGWISLGKGQYAEVRGPAKTVARMAQAVRVSPEQLAETGREDAAAALRERLNDEPVFADNPDLKAIRRRFEEDPEGMQRWLTEAMSLLIGRADPETLADLAELGEIARSLGQDNDEPDRRAG